MFGEHVQCLPICKPGTLERCIVAGCGRQKFRLLLWNSSWCRENWKFATATRGRACTRIVGRQTGGNTHSGKPYLTTLIQLQSRPQSLQNLSKRMQSGLTVLNQHHNPCEELASDVTLSYDVMVTLSSVPVVTQLI